MRLNKKEKGVLIAAGAGLVGYFLYKQYKKAQNIELTPQGINNFNVSLIQNKLSFVFVVGLFNPMDIKVNLKGLTGVIVIDNNKIGSFDLVAELPLLPNQGNTLEIEISLPLTSLITSAASIASKYLAGDKVGINIDYTAKTNLGNFKDSYNF